VIVNQFSRYMPEILAFATGVGAKAAYCFIIDGSKGTGGCPVVLGAEALSGPVYQQRCEELIGLLRRSAEMLEQDLARQGFQRQS
jgi:hypothetical protein